MTPQEYKEQIGLSRYEVWYGETDNCQSTYQVFDNCIGEFVSKPYKYPEYAYKLQRKLERLFMYGA